MEALDPQQQAARTWFESLRDRICAEFEAIEREAGSDASFDYLPWDRQDPSGEPGGGGVRGLMKGKVFEQVGVNVSTVGGTFTPEFAKPKPAFIQNTRNAVTSTHTVSSITFSSAPDGPAAGGSGCRRLRR